MRPLALAAIVVTATISPLTAQGSTAELLGQAHEFYERLEVERALPLLRQIVSPNWPFEVTQEQRVEAYKYLGACLTLAGKRDSAVLYFPPSSRLSVRPSAARSPSPSDRSSRPVWTRGPRASRSPSSPPMPRW